MKRFLKKLMKKGVYSYTGRKYWIFMRPNLTLSKKSKNSRMGKGKGAFLRKSFRTKIFSPLVEFRGVNPLLIQAFLKYFIFKTRLNYKCIYSMEEFYNYVGVRCGSKFLFKKYQFFK